MLTGPDLVSAGYETSNSILSLLGGTVNATQPNLAPRTNLRWFGLGNPSDGALAATGVACAVPIPALPGDVFTKVTIFVGATAASTPTHGFAALYSGIATPALLAQSADTTTGVIAASAAYTYTLASAVTVTAANAPNGFIYASISGTGTAVQTALSVATPTAIGYQWTANGPLFLSATHGSALGGTAPATIASPAAKAVAPIAMLT